MSSFHMYIGAYINTCLCEVVICTWDRRGGHFIRSRMFFTRYVDMLDYCWKIETYLDMYVFFNVMCRFVI